MQKNILPRALACSLAAFFIITIFPSTAIFGQRAAPARRAAIYDVQHYVISTGFDVPRKTVIGAVDVTLKPLSAGFDSFELDAESMNIEQVSLASGRKLNSIQRGEKLLITLDRAYNNSESITVNIRYRAKPRRGLYFVSSSGRRPAQIWTQGQPQDNHHWFPCYDSPDDKATSEQYITAPAGQLAIGNGALVDTKDNSDGTRTFHWKMNQPYSTYLTSLVVGDYAKLTDTYKNTPLEYYIYHGTEQISGYAFGKTPAMMQWFSSKLRYEYPYDKYAQVILGDYDRFDGMENITTTTYADSEILNANYPDTDAENLVTHELAHSWFGNLVTCKSWADLWLNEGFATFFEAGFQEQQAGREAYLEAMRDNMRQYFGEDPSGRRHPLSNTNYQVGMSLFDNTTYQKGALVVHMLRETVGDEIFWKALNAYLNEFKFSNVESRDLQRVFERVSGRSLEWFFDQWVYKAGYPELRVRSTYNTGSQQLTLTVTQTQMPTANTPAVFQLPVEIEIATASGTRTERIEINKRAQNFDFQLDGKPSMVMFDKRAGILKKIDFQQPRLMAAYLMLDGADPADRRQALQATGVSGTDDFFAFSRGSWTADAGLRTLTLIPAMFRRTAQISSWN